MTNNPSQILFEITNIQINILFLIFGILKIQNLNCGLNYIFIVWSSIRVSLKHI